MRKILLKRETINQEDVNKLSENDFIEEKIQPKMKKIRAMTKVKRLKIVLRKKIKKTMIQQL